MGTLQERALTSPEFNHLFFHDIWMWVITLFLVVMGVYNFRAWFRKLAGVFQTKKGFVDLIIHGFVCGLIVFFGLCTGGTACLLTTDLRANQATVFSATLSEHRIAKGGKGGPSYYLDFKQGSAPVTELGVSEAAYAVVQNGQPVTIAYVPRSRMVLTVNGSRGY